MKIGVIGAGHIGKAIARHAVAASHDVVIANSREPQTLTEIAREIGARAVTARDAAAAEDIVVLAITPAAIKSLPQDFFAVTPGAAAIIDPINYYPRTRDGAIAEIDNGMLESEWVARRIGRPVVKAFNMIKANTLATGARARGAAGRVAIGLAADEAGARERVAGFIDEIGFDPVDAGVIAESWRLQPGTTGYCHDYDATTLRVAIEASDRSHLAFYRQQSDAFASGLVKLMGSVDAVGAAAH